jgi:acetolactate synthase-1/2/3 large subunit
MDVLELEPKNPDELDEKIEEMINIDKPVIFDCHVDQAEKLFSNDSIRKTS